MPLLSIRECPPFFVGVEHAVEPLVKLGHLSCPAFHVAAPQSRPMDFLPDRAGQDSERPHPALVQSLGHAKFVRQGGETGDFMDRHMSIKYPNSDVAGLPARMGER
ncbi:hypothetical protein Trisim1_001454 [Trichoderma cf. simile WF8]